MSKDPAARARSMRNLKNAPPAKKGSQHALKSGARARGPVGDIATARKDIQEALAAATPLRDLDGSLPVHDAAATELVACGLARYRHMQEFCERVGAFTIGGKLRYTLVRELRRAEKQLMLELHELGLTPRGRAALGFDMARTQAAMQHHAEPDRSPEHRRRMIKVLHEAHVLPSAEEAADVIESTSTKEKNTDG